MMSEINHRVTNESINPASTTASLKFLELTKSSNCLPLARVVEEHDDIYRNQNWKFSV